MIVLAIQGPLRFRLILEFYGNLDRNYIEFVVLGDSNDILTIVDLQFITIECISIYLCL